MRPVGSERYQANVHCFPILIHINAGHPSGALLSHRAAPWLERMEIIP